MISYTLLFHGKKWQITSGQTADARPYITDGKITYFYQPSPVGRLTYAQRNDIILPHVQETGNSVWDFYYCKPGRSRRQSQRAAEHALRYHKPLI